MGMSDMFGAGALAALGKAAGQDFLSPMLEDVRDKDRFLFQQRETEKAIAAERKRRREESSSSKRNLLAAYKQAGALTDEDIIGSGGADALSEMDDSEFAMAMAQFSDNRLRDMADTDLFAAVRGMSAAAGIALPEGGLKTREQALELQARIQYQKILEQDNKGEAAETRKRWNENIDAIQQDFASRDPLSITMEGVNEIKGALTGAAARLGQDADQLDDDGDALIQRIRTIGNGLSSLETAARANQYDAAFKKEPLLFFQEYGNMDLPLQQAVEGRPQAQVIQSVTQEKYKALQGMSPQAAADGQVGAAWQAIQGVNSFEELLMNPRAAAAVYGADVQAARRLAADKSAEDSATVQAQSIQAAVADSYALLSIDPPTTPIEPFITRTSTLEGLEVKFDANGYRTAVALEIAKRDISQQQAFTLARAREIPNELKDKATEVARESLQTPQAIEMVRRAQDETAEEFAGSLTAWAQGLTSLQTERPLTPEEQTREQAKRPKGQGLISEWILGPVPTSLPNEGYRDAENRVIQQGALAWRTRDLRDDAETAYLTAEAESRDLAGTALEQPAEENKQAAEQLRTTMTTAYRVREKMIRAALSGLSGQAGSATLVEGDATFAQVLDLKSAPATAAEIVEQFRAKATREVLVHSSDPGGSDTEATDFDRMFSDEIASMMEIAETVDNALADPAHQEALFKATAKRRPKWVDSPEKMNAWFFLRSAEESLELQ